jgi:TPR repeat protein
MTTSSVRWLTLTLAALLLSAGTAPSRQAEPGKPSGEELLLRGAYDKIASGESPRERALWAFARYHLAPSKDVYDAALEAHQKGDPLGTFVVLLCHQEGRAVRRDEKVMHELNHTLRKTLSAKKEPTSVELYLLSNTSAASAEGVIKGDEVGPDDRQRRDWLQQAADKGFAEAVFELGKKYQREEKHDKALELFDKAAEAGLAAGWRARGFARVEGLGTAKDAEKGFAMTMEGAKRGDVFAMVSLSFYYDKGWGTKRDLKESHDWIEKAAQTGHWLGYLERAQSRFQGINGFEMNKDEAKRDVERALDTRNRDVLEALALWYTNAIGVDRDGRKAIRFGEAAFVQGSHRAARIVAHVYKQGLGGIEVDEKRATFWTVQSNPNEAFVLEAGLDRMFPDLVARLKKLDPWDVR